MEGGRQNTNEELARRASQRTAKHEEREIPRTDSECAKERNEDRMTNGFSAPEIEQAALSAMLQWDESCDKGLAALSPDYFFADAHKKIFAAISDQRTAGRPIDLISFTHYLRANGELASVGGEFYVTQTYTTCLAPAAFDYYTQILYGELAKRRLLATCTEVSKSNLAAMEDPVTETILQLEDIPRYQPKKDPSLSEAVNEKIERMERHEQDKGIVKTGIAKLDYHSPLWLADMPLIAGERKAGKSILALTIAVNVARQNIPVAYFSLEDSQRKVVDRLLSGISRVPLNVQDHVANMTQEEVGRSINAAAKLKSLPLTIYDDVFDLHAIIGKLREVKNKQNIGLAVVDYGQLVRVPTKKDRTREQEVAQASRAFRLIAMELEIPLILLSQLNENGFTRESRALEQDATAMWKVVADEDEPHKRWIEIPWQRNGDSNVRFPVTFIGSCARIENYQPEHAEEKAA